MYIVSRNWRRYKLLGKTLKSIEPFTPSAKKRVRDSVLDAENLQQSLVKYDTEGAIIIEKYCDKCAKAIEDSSQKHAN